MKWLGKALWGAILLVPLCATAKTATPGTANTPSVSATSESTPKLKVVNIMPAFWKFEAQAKHLNSQAERVAAFRRLVIDPYPIYDIHEFRKNVTDAGIARYLEWVKPHLPRMRTLSAQVPSEVEPGLARFMKTFPDFDPRGITVYIMPSFHHFAGQTHGSKNGHTAVMFGTDRIASLMGENTHLAVLISHELFHAYHHQIYPDIGKQRKLYTHLWQEGLATWVSAKINPEVPAATVLASTTFGNDGPELVARAARAFLPVFSSTSGKDADKFFLWEYKGHFPRLTGYLLGYKVCQRIGRHYTLKQMAHLGGSRLKTMIHAAVEALARSAPPSSAVSAP